MTIVGAIFTPQRPPGLAVEAARAADAAGLEELWLWEDCFAEGGIATAAAMLGATERLRIGLGLLPVPLRNVALTAMELSAIAGMFPGRLIAGLGHGVQEWMGQVGAGVSSPVTLLREYLTALRELLAGREVSTAGRYVSLDRVRLNWPPANPPPLYSGGYGPNTLRLCGEIADGTIISGGTTLARLREIVGLIEQGRTRAEEARPHRVVVFVDARRRGAADHVGVSGSGEQVAAGLREWVDAGADSVLLVPDRDVDDLSGYLQFVAQEVAPLLR
jgi:alkanesulfonate monooxygenase SsuD/methylene tetrahydromethanopterin reductase-like flavin-dependent oxidoreductase (luciferase family)